MENIAPGLTCEQLRLGYDAQDIVCGVDLMIPAGSITAVLGPNGSGKSTLLRGLGRMLAPRKGRVLLDGRTISELPTKQVARQMSVLPQSPQAPEGLSVAEPVSYGRYPRRRGVAATLTELDRRAIGDALALTGLLELAGRPVGELSGGQRQRAWIAMAIAQDAEVLLLDEPTTFLDIAHQFEVLEILRELNCSRGRTIVMVMHDINHAARYADFVVAMAEGRIVATGTPEQVITSALLSQVFGIEADILRDPRTGRPLCVGHPAPRARAVPVPAAGPSVEAWGAGR